MKEVALEGLWEGLGPLLEIAQLERVIITRKGKPSAVILGLEYKDEEDYALERDASFWQMIRDRRNSNEKMIPLEELRKQLGISEKRKKTVGQKRSKEK